MKDRLFSYFGVSAKREDVFKDISGKGISERYQECCGEGYDDEIQDLLDNGRDKIVVPSSMKATLIPVMESMLGGIVMVSYDQAIRRKIIQFAHRIYNVKGTYKGFQIPLMLLGFTDVEIEEITFSGTFDEITFDDETRTFDSEPGCGCGKYKLILTGPVAITPAILEAVQRIITFNQPINADLIQVEYHGAIAGIGVMIVGSTFIVGGGSGIGLMIVGSTFIVE